MELTDRNEVLRQMRNSRTDCPYEGQQAGAWKVAHDCCISIVESVDAIEAEPVRHGRWVSKGDYAVCTECGGRSGTQYDGVEPIPLMTKYCPHCGAEMYGRK